MFRTSDSTVSWNFSSDGGAERCKDGPKRSIGLFLYLEARCWLTTFNWSWLQVYEYIKKILKKEGSAAMRTNKKTWNKKMVRCCK